MNLVMMESYALSTLVAPMVGVQLLQLLGVLLSLSSVGLLLLEHAEIIQYLKLIPMISMK
jgi:hypothetical protein